MVADGEAGGGVGGDAAAGQGHRAAEVLAVHGELDRAGRDRLPGRGGDGGRDGHRLAEHAGVGRRRHAHGGFGQPPAEPGSRNPALILSDVDAAGTLFGYVDSANLPGYGIAYANGTYTTFQDPERPGQGRPRRQHRRPRGQVSGRILSPAHRPGDLHLRR